MFGGVSLSAREGVECAWWVNSLSEVCVKMGNGRD